MELQSDEREQKRSINNQNAKRLFLHFFCFKLSFILTKCSCRTKVIEVQYINCEKRKTDKTVFTIFRLIWKIII